MSEEQRVRHNIESHLFGRMQIFTATEYITAENVVEEVNRAMVVHIQNLQEEDYLYWYRRGLQPILDRTKEVRPEICNKVVVNNAEQICAFKNGYFLQKPIAYVSRRNDDDVNDAVRKYNEYVFTSGKYQADNAAVDWFHTVGVGVEYIEPNRDDDGEKPVNVYALDPRSAFVVYSLRPGNKPVYGVNIVVVGQKLIFDVFTEQRKFTLEGGWAGTAFPADMTNISPKVGVAQSVVGEEPNILGQVPIIEYTYNAQRMSAFEPAISIMDTINLVESNRVDGVEQTVQSLCVAVNCQFEEGVDANTIREAGMIALTSTDEHKEDFKILNETLDQEQTQVTLDDLYQQMLFKCSMPSTTSGGQRSTSDTGTAVYLRDGFQTADTAARNTTDLFEASNRYFDRIFIKILTLKGLIKLGLNDFELRIERNSTSNLLAKTQAALNMKMLGLAPQIALERSGVSSDPLTDIEISGDYIALAWGGEQEGEAGTEANNDPLRMKQGNYVGGYYRKNPTR